ncbi:toll-like receptor 6 isoform X2 [Sabethes cyaneus]|uniref:toll-like receptor 6 isoform X2 n=1 Tax=Sabethes cyaneus TaxID=53552 RepID=UPI00237E98B9|nr:toll-like receptor 6 isoform X2 [Sabethes cyaneus]
MYRHRFKIVCFCVLISTVFSYELRSSTPGRNQYNQETPDSSGANTNGGSFISYPKETSNSPYNPSRTGVSPYYGRFNYVCSIETWNYDCQFKDVILKLPQHSVTFGPVPNSKQKLAFQNSTLEYLPKSLIDAFPRMQVLNLEGLQIREIDSNTFQTASELLELYMQNNQLKEIKSNTFSGARKLELLDLSYNAIESNRIAPNFLFAVPNLQQFKINSNRISQLPLSQQNYNLQYITASENSITHIEADQFRNNYQLSELDFSYNRLEYFDLQQLDDKQNLLLINVNHNYLRAFHIPQYVKTLFA